MLRRRAALFLLFMSLPVVEHMILVPLIYDIAGRDAWISALLVMPIGVFLAYLVWRIMNMYPQQILPETSIKLWGKIAGNMINLIWLVYFFLMGTITLTSLFDMFQAGFYEDTPIWFTGLALMLLVIYSVNKGIKTIAWIAGILSISLFIAGNAVGLILMSEREWRHLLPILEYGWTPVISGVILLGAIWTEMLSISVLRFYKVETKGMLYALILGALLNGFMIVGITAGTISVFGFEQTDNMQYPSLSSIRIVKLGFVDRLDIFAMVLMAVGSYIRLSLYLYVTTQFLPEKIKNKYKNKLTYLFGVLIYFFSLYIFRDKLFYDQLLRYYVLTIFLWILPFIYLIRHRFKRNKG